MELIIEESKQATRLPSILKAALYLFVQKGIEVTTIKDIAKRARVSEGALYRHFKSKEQLAWYLFSTHLNRFSRDILSKVNAEKDVQKKVFAVIHTCFEAFEKDRVLFTYLILSEHREFRKFPPTHRHLGLIILDFIEAGQKAGLVRDTDPNVLTAMLLGTIIRTCIFKMYGRISQDLRRQAPDLADSMWSAVKNNEEDPMNQRQNKIARAIGAFSGGVGAFIAAEIVFWLVLWMLPWPARSSYRYGSAGYHLPRLIIGCAAPLLGSCVAAYAATSKFGGLGLTWGAVFGSVGGGVCLLSTLVRGELSVPWSYFLPLLPLAASVTTGLWAERVSGAGEGTPADPDGAPPAASIPPEVEQRISWLEEKAKGVDDLLERLSRLERQVAGWETPRQTAASAMAQPAPRKPAALPVSPSPRPSKPAAPRAPRREFSLDDLLEGRWLFRLGMSIFLLGVAFFLKYSFENHWIGPMGRVMLGFISGVAFILLGDHQQRKGLALYGQTLTGGGIGILYLSIFGAFHLYHFLGQVPAFLVMALVTLTAAVLALRYSSITIIVIAMLGGFATPALLSTGVVQELPLFTYLAILSLGVLAVSSFKNWRPINLLAFLLTQIWIQGYFAGPYYSPERFGVLFFFTTLYFSIFLVPNLRFNILERNRSEAADLVLLLGNAGIYYLTVYFRLLEGSPWESWEAYLAVLASAVYFILARTTYPRAAEDRYLLLSELGLATTFATMVIPIALDWEWVTIGWAIEALILTWIGFDQNDRWTRWAGSALFLAAGSRLLAFDTTLRTAYEAALTTRSLSFLAVLGLMAAGIKLAHARYPDLTPDERSFSGVLPTAWNLLFLFWLCVEAKDFLKYRFILSHPAISLDQYTMVAFSVIWTLYACALMGIGLGKRSKPIQLGAGLLFAATALKVILLDMSQLPLGSRVISFLVLGGLMLFVSYFIQKQGLVKEPS